MAPTIRMRSGQRQRPAWSSCGGPSRKHWRALRQVRRCFIQVLKFSRGASHSALSLRLPEALGTLTISLRLRQIDVGELMGIKLAEREPSLGTLIPSHHRRPRASAVAVSLITVINDCPPLRYVEFVSSAPMGAKRFLRTPEVRIPHMTRNHLPSLNALVAFETFGRLGRMTLAADELCVSHGAISRY